MFEAGNIEMALAEELEAMTLAKEVEEEQKEIEERAKVEQESKNSKVKDEEEKPPVKEDTENILKDTHENHQVPKNLEESKSNAKIPSSYDDVDAITDRLQATEISSSKKDSAPAKATTKDKSN